MAGGARGCYPLGLPKQERTRPSPPGREASGGSTESKDEESGRCVQRLSLLKKEELAAW